MVYSRQTPVAAGWRGLMAAIMVPACGKSKRFEAI